MKLTEKNVNKRLREMVAHEMDGGRVMYGSCEPDVCEAGRAMNSALAQLLDHLLKKADPATLLELAGKNMIIQRYSKLNTAYYEGD